MDVVRYVVRTIRDTDIGFIKTIYKTRVYNSVNMYLEYINTIVNLCEVEGYDMFTVDLTDETKELIAIIKLKDKEVVE